MYKKIYIHIYIYTYTYTYTHSHTHSHTHTPHTHTQRDTHTKYTQQAHTPEQGHDLVQHGFHFRIGHALRTLPQSVVYEQ